jgi:hypothetical protein
MPSSGLSRAGKVGQRTGHSDTAESYAVKPEEIFPGMVANRIPLRRSAGRTRKRSQIGTESTTIIFFVIIIFEVVFVVPFFFVVGIVEAEFVIIFFVIDRGKVEFDRIDRDHLELDTAFRAGYDLSHIVEFFIDNGFAFRTVAHNIPPIKTFPETETIYLS